MKRADVKVWFACNNLCEFCVQWDKRLRYKQRTLDEIKTILDDEFKNWCLWVVFTWWEPTVHKDLVKAVEYAKKIWYLEIQIQSNWMNFENLEYCIKLIKAWVTEFSPSIHWFNQETHDELVWTPWSWKKVVKWLYNLKKLWQKVIINSVVTKKNYKEIPSLALLLAKIWVDQFQFAFVHILWSAAKNSNIIVPKKNDCLPYIKAWLDIWKKYNITCMTEAIPFCLMQGYEWAIAEYNFMPETTVVDAEYRTQSYAEYRWNEWKTKHEKCWKCIKNDICEWPWKEYPDIYWWDEFNPIL